MTMYFIRPVDRKLNSRAWSHTLPLALKIKMQLQRVTGLKWKITKEEINYDDPV